ncbi:MAG: peptidoglycan DD-metalloendopeptidase family protein [Firmicutes bacterium]|nr:peptidoglycan DD-metalloendopeptidase family protein [Bacillota bacterium]
MKLSLTGKIFILALILAAALSSISFGKGSNSTIHQKKRELKETYARLRVEKQRLKLANMKERDMAKQLKRTQTQVHEIKEDIHYTAGRVNETYSRLKTLAANLKKTYKQYTGKQKILRRRLRDIYESGDLNYLEVMLDAVNFSDFLSRYELLSKILEKDQKLLRTIGILKAKIEDNKRKAQDNYNYLVIIKKDMELKKVSLSSVELKRKNLLSEIEDRRSHYVQKVYELEEHTVAIENQIQDLIRRKQQEGSGPSHTYPKGSTGSLSWPLRAPISSYFGYRRHPILGRTILHTGIDLAAGYGTPIAAADGGVVILAGWCGGYGNAVIIDHGNGISTLYGHCSRLYVSAGQIVRKGQTIALVGSTGRSTGPHLHFEVRQNGVPVDPLSLLP